jgi:peptidoglycan-associated lipoprotein
MKPLLVLSFSILAVGAVACGENKPPATPSEPVSTTTTRNAAPTVHGTIGVSQDLEKACHLVAKPTPQDAPKFAFDDSTLLAEDRDVLDQVARCLTQGPLKGRAVRLVGRADPRGTTEYNFALGAHRASTVEKYLAAGGVAQKQLHETSRGELDATGKDENAWRADRRVDLSLEP